MWTSQTTATRREKHTKRLRDPSTPPRFAQDDKVRAHLELMRSMRAENEFELEENRIGLALGEEIVRL